MNKNNYLFLIIFLCLISFFCSREKIINPANFKARYHFDYNLIDSSGQYNHANKFGNSIKYDIGARNYGIRFNNKNIRDSCDVNDYLQLPNISVKNFSVAFWILFERNNHNYTASVYSFGDDKIAEGSKNFFSVYVSPIGMSWVFMQSGINSISTPQIDISDGHWTHITFTISNFNNMQNSEIKLWKDTVLYYTKTLNFISDYYDLPQYIALQQWENGKYKSSRFSGMIDELFISPYIYNYDDIKRFCTFKY
jgi:hypothetical protein